ncbi:MAG: hypothetical protein GY711_12515 [bacterium]|nr:hypothetical protein [bacterium]
MSLRALAARAVRTPPGRALLGLAMLAMAGCGYSTGISLAPEHTSIGVEIFGRDGRKAPERGLERELHVELLRATRDLVDADVRRPSEADLVMRGTVTGYRRRAGVRSSGNVQLETGLIVSVEAELWDRAAKKQVAGPLSFTTRVGYTLDALDAEVRARERLLANLADRIVLQLMTGQHVEPQSDAGDPVTVTEAPQGLP